MANNKDMRNLNQPAPPQQNVSKMQQEMGVQVTRPEVKEACPAPKELTPTDRLPLNDLELARAKLLDEIKELEERRDRELHRAPRGEGVPEGAVRRKFQVTLPDCGTRLVEVDVYPNMEVLLFDLAVKEFNRSMGVIRSDRRYSVSEVPMETLTPVVAELQEV